MKKLFAAAAAAAAVSSLVLSIGCQDDGGDTDVLIGNFIDSPVEGICYITETQEGCTDADGTYKYKAGETITFSIGNVTFPSKIAESKMTPLILSSQSCLDDEIDSLLNCPSVINMVRFLQSLDEDGNPNNGILITNEAAQATFIHVAVQGDVDFTVSVEEFENSPTIIGIIADGGGFNTTIISVEDAIEHIANELQITANWYPDGDTDGFGDTDGTVVVQFDKPAGHVIDNTDCNDNDDSIHPNAAEVLDGIDNDCDGLIDEGLYFIGDTGPAGGIVFYVDGSGLSGLEAALTDQDDGTGAEWGCHGTDITGADGTAIGTGAQNTAEILLECTDAGTAAYLADIYTLNGYSDWFLPSEEELVAFVTFMAVHSPTNMAGCNTCVFWSSTEVDMDDAVVVGYASVLPVDRAEDPKNTVSGHLYGLVRAIRAF